MNEFFKKHVLNDPDIILEQEKMCEAMELGLKVQTKILPMIPAYLNNSENIPDGESAIIIDAGGTNFRRALVTFEDGLYTVSESFKTKMPGIDKPASWEEFISFIADQLMPIIQLSDRIGFCFSYEAVITPEADGIVTVIDKEVTITGSEGQYVGKSLSEEFERRGIPGKKVVVLNDTVAVLMGGSALMDKSLYRGFVGQVSGTGMNVCCELPFSRVKKLGIDDEKSVLVNLEAGTYDGIKGGDLDWELDAESKDPGKKLLEKQISGVYVGEICRKALFAAAKEGFFTEATAAEVLKLARFGGSTADAFACGEDPLGICATKEDNATVTAICRRVFERSAALMAITLLAVIRLTADGSEKPLCIIAEGSLVQRGHFFRPRLEALLEEYGDKLGLSYKFLVGDESTLPGSAAAAILNIR